MKHWLYIVLLMFPLSLYAHQDSIYYQPDTTKASEEDFKKAKAKVTVPSEAAEIIVSGMEAGKWKIIIGKDCKQMDLLTRLAPRFAMKKLAEAMKKLHAIK